MVKMNITLSSVDVSQNNSSELYGFDTDSISSVLSYRDNIISTKWEVGVSDIVLTLENLTDKTIKIIWDDAAFIDVDGKAARIMHTGTKYIDRNDFQPPTIIPKKTSVIESIVPTRYVYITDYGWVEGKLFVYKTYDLKETINYYTGKHVKLLIPIVVSEDTIEYIFDFKVKSVTKFKIPDYNSYYYYDLKKKEKSDE
jgi:hypothetical protein